MKEIIGKCPLCGGNIFENPKSYGCGNWKEKGCKFTIWKHDCHGHDFTVDEVKKLLSGGAVGPLKLKSKAGKDYTASLYYNKENARVELKFPPRENKPTNATPAAPAEIEHDEVPEVPTMDADMVFGEEEFTDAVFDDEEGLPFN